jgi:hypothetical protein
MERVRYCYRQERDFMRRLIACIMFVLLCTQAITPVQAKPHAWAKRHQICDYAEGMSEIILLFTTGMAIGLVGFVGFLFLKVLIKEGLPTRREPLFVYGCPCCCLDEIAFLI